MASGQFLLHISTSRSKNQSLVKVLSSPIHAVLQLEPIKESLQRSPQGERHWGDVQEGDEIPHPGVGEKAPTVRPSFVCSPMVDVTGGVVRQVQGGAHS